MLQEFSEIFGDEAKPDAREEVHREAGVLHSVSREDSVHVLFHFSLLVLEPLRKLLHAQVLRHLLEQVLDEDAAGRGGVLLGEANAGQAAPLDAVGVEEMGEELGAIPNLVHFVPMYLLELGDEHLVEIHLVCISYLAEPLSQMSVEARERLLLHATLADH